jgi:ferredoxin
MCRPAGARAAPLPRESRLMNPRPLPRLVVDPVACDGIGMCSHLAPSLVKVDSWGYPIIVRDPMTTREKRQANKAVVGCPRNALLLAAPRPVREP